MKIKTIVAVAIASLFATSWAFAAPAMGNDMDEMGNNKGDASDQMAFQQFADNNVSNPMSGSNGPAAIMGPSVGGMSGSGTATPPASNSMSGTAQMPAPAMSGASSMPDDSSPDTATGDDDY